LDEVLKSEFTSQSRISKYCQNIMNDTTNLQCDKMTT